MQATQTSTAWVYQPRNPRERLMAEERAKQSEQRYRALLEQRGGGAQE